MNGWCERSGKAKHDTAANAMKALVRLGNKGSTYRCPHCRCYHFTSFPADAGSTRRARAKARFKQQLRAEDESE